jgi:hypothetical protein
VEPDVRGLMDFKMESFLNHSEYTLKVICLIVAGAFAVFEYLDYRQTLRVQEAIRIYKDLYLKAV